MSLTYGAMFAGYGGLEMGVQSVLGGSTLWHAEIDAAPSKILAHHWPDTLNLGDVTKVDWPSVPKVDVLTGGFPCQDVSHAGKRLGLRPGTRTGLWSHMAYVIDKLRPGLVVIENVRGLLSATAVGDVEPCAWCVGDGERSPMRALGCVLADLAELGYDSRVYGLRAADVGAPHGRFRVFVFAYPAGDPWRFEHGDCGVATDARGEAVGLRPGLRAGDQGGQWWGRPDHNPAPAAGPELVAAEHHRDTLADAGVQRHGRGQDGGGLGRVDGHDAGEARQRERAREVAGDRGATAPADTRDGLHGEHSSGMAGTQTSGQRGDQGERGRPADSGRGAATDWGIYAPAVHQWEHILGRPAPAPTEPGPKGRRRLSPAFVEWMQGLDAGHVTGVPGISRNDQLKALGNGVVPQQAAAATRMWLAHLEAERGAA